jgi:dTDP-4-dehydrorhamnose reductase
MNNLLIGASGLLGSNLKIESNRPTSSDLNILSVASIGSYFDSIQEPENIVLCAAYTNVAKANLDKNYAFNLNVSAVQNICKLLNKKYSGRPRLIYISTDYVFDGITGLYKTSDPINPVQNNYYAMTKALGESSARAYENSCIIRTSFCKSDSWPYEFAFDDQFTSRDTVDIIAPMIDLIILNKSNGIHHVGTKRKSVFDLAKKIKEDIKPISRLSIKNVTIPYDTSFENE